MIEVCLELWLHHDVGKEFWFRKLQANMHMDNAPDRVSARRAGKAVSTKRLFVRFMYKSKSNPKNIVK